MLVAPIVVLPTQVEVRLALCANLGSAGLTSGFWVLVGVAMVLASIVALCALYGLARIDAAAFERLLNDPELIDPLLAAPPQRGGTISAVFVVQALTLIALILAAGPLAASIGQATLDEILRPSSGASIFARVFARIGPAVIVLLAAVPLIDTISALATRRVLLSQSLRSAVGGAIADLVRAPSRTIPTAMVAWLSLLLVLLGAGWALSVAWQAARATFLATTSFSDMVDDVGTFIIALLLAAVFVAGLALGGYVAAFRAALWTVAGARQ